MAPGDATIEICNRRGPVDVAGNTLPPDGGSPPRRDSFHVTFDAETESVVEVIVNAVALVHDVERTALDPIAKSIDPDSLDRLFTPDTSIREVSFVYEDLSITVQHDGDIWFERV